MTNSVTFPVNLGGDGSTVTDDDNASTGLGNGGHRTRFVPAMGQIVAVANTLTQRLAEQSDTSTTSLAIATGSKSFVTAGFYEWAVGMYVVAASTSSPANRMYGQVTSWTTSTNTLVVNVLAIDGSGTFSSWTVSLSGPPNLTTLPNVISVNSTTDALRITQLGTGNALLVEDSSNPDATPFVIDAVGNLGLGVTPSGWGAYTGVLEFPGGANIEGFSTGFLGLGSNHYYNGTNFIYKISSYASRLTMDSTGEFKWYTAPSGTAGNAISFTQAMTLDASGLLSVGRTSAWDSNAVLTLEKSGVAAQVINSTTNTVTLINVANGSSAFAYTGTQSNHPFAFFTNGVERARIDSSGNLLVGTTSTSFANQGARMLASGQVQAISASGSDSFAGYRLTTTAGDSIITGYSNVGGTQVLKFNAMADGNVRIAAGATYGNISDRKYKTNIVDATSKLEDVLQLRVRNFNVVGSDYKVIGFIAQEFETVFPSLVTESDDKDFEGNFLGTTSKGIKESALVPILVKAIQELTAELNELKKRIN